MEKITAEIDKSEDPELGAALVLGVIDGLVNQAHGNSKSKGFWDEPLNTGQAVALIHSEVSELLEAIRNGNPFDEHCPEFTSAEIESADIVIRVMDLAGGRKWRLGAAILAKMKFNQGRPHKHGKAF